VCLCVFGVVSWLAAVGRSRSVLCGWRIFGVIIHVWVVVVDLFGFGLCLLYVLF